jgi:hypothetical protein
VVSIADRAEAGNISADLRALSETGATGLEPATSGVTGLFHGYDDWRKLTAIALLMRLSGLQRLVHAGFNSLGFERLLPFCCP